MKPTIPITSTYQISTTSSKSSTTGPSPTPSTFFLVANETYPNELVGSYLKLIPDPEPFIPPSRDKALQFGNKNSTGAANFTLFDNGTLQANSESGPLYAGTPAGKSTGAWTFEFADPNELDELGLTAVACDIPNPYVLTCQAGELRAFNYATMTGYLFLQSLPILDDFTLLMPVPT